jgi:hypothetical protein
MAENVRPFPGVVARNTRDLGAELKLVRDEVPAAQAHHRSYDRTVGLGSVRLRPLLGYLVGWSVVLVMAWVAACATTYEILLRSGVVRSVSRSLSTVLDVELASSGLLPVFTWTHVLVGAVLSGGLLAIAWLLATLGAVFVHNGLSRLLGAPRIRLQP